jgi:enediyne biosynthesis protein E4
MRWQERGFRPHVVRLAALVLVLALYGAASLPQASAAEGAALAGRFAFIRSELPGVPELTTRSIRNVHPTLQHIAPWVSAVGAGVALADLDGDGLPNDLCHVDPRSNTVLVAPVPGTGTRYAAVRLDPGPALYEPARMAPMGCLPGDFNEDGRMDLLAYYWGRAPLLFLRRDPALSEAAFLIQEIVSGAPDWYTNAATLADLDGDGHLDLVIGNYYADESRILDAEATGTATLQDSMSRAFNGGGPRLLHWKRATGGAAPSATFEPIDAGLDELAKRGWVLATGAADLDGDQLPELYIANDFGPDRLLHNRSTPGTPRFAVVEGERTLTTPRSKALGQDSFKGMGIDFGDLNGDGLLDLYVSNIADEYALEESHLVFQGVGPREQLRQRLWQGRAPYVDVSEVLGLSRGGWAWDARLADFDNDGVLEALQATGFLRGQQNRWPELHELAMSNDQLVHDPRSWFTLRPGDDLSGHNRNPFYVRGSDGRYANIASQLEVGEPGVSRGIAIADVDGDGRLDYAVANQWAPSSFYYNRAPNPDAFLGLRLRLPIDAHNPADAAVLADAEMSRPAIGATATISLADGRRLVGQVDGGNGHSGKRSPELHFGLGDTTEPVLVELAWRDPLGRPHRAMLHLAPGWHTILLGSAVGGED